MENSRESSIIAEGGKIFDLNEVYQCFQNRQKDRRRNKDDKQDERKRVRSPVW